MVNILQEVVIKIYFVGNMNKLKKNIKKYGKVHPKKIMK